MCSECHRQFCPGSCPGAEPPADRAVEADEGCTGGYLYSDGFVYCSGTVTGIKSDGLLRNFVTGRAAFIPDAPSEENSRRPEGSGEKNGEHLFDASPPRGIKEVYDR